MNPSSSSMAPALSDYHKTSTNLRSKILQSEEQRIQLEQKLHSLSTIDSRLKQQKQNEHIQAYITRLNQESHRAEQRNLQLLNDIQRAEHNLTQLHVDTERLIRKKHDLLQYLESISPNRQNPVSTETNTNVNNNIYDFNRLHQRPTTHQLQDADSSTLFKHYEDQSRATNSPRIKDQQQDDQSISESTSNTFSRSKRAGSLRMELSRTGLYFLLNYIEKELVDTIEKKKFYRHDPPTITQIRTILNIANDQQQFAIKDLDPTTTSMFILDQLPSTIRRTTAKQCLLTEDILSLNIKDLDKDTITKMLPEKDRLLWTRLIDHFTQLLKFHIMSSQTLANKFAPILLPNNVLYLHDKAKNLLQHIVEKLVGTQQSSSDDETSTDRKYSIQQVVKTNPISTPSSWLNKSTSGHGISDDDTSSATATPKKNTKSISSAATTPRANIHQDDDDLDFFG